MGFANSCNLIKRTVTTAFFAVLLFSFASFASIDKLPDNYSFNTSGEVIPVKLSGNQYQFCYSKYSTYSTTALARYGLTVSDNRYVMNDGGLEVSENEIYGFGYSPVMTANVQGRYFVWALRLYDLVPRDIFLSAFDNGYGVVDMPGSSGISKLNDRSAFTPHIDCYYYAPSDDSRMIYFISKEPIPTSDVAVNISMPLPSAYALSRFILNTELYGYYSDNPFFTVPPPSHEEITEKRLNNIQSLLSNLQSGFQSSLDWLSFNVTNNVSGLPIGSTHQISVSSIDDEGDEFTTTKTFNYPSYYEYTITIQDEAIHIQSNERTGTFLGILHRKFNEFIEFWRCQFALLRSWYYPLTSNELPQYWRVYNSDNGQTVSVNPATVTYYITWYLGKLYEHLTADIDSVLETPVENTKQAITTLENAEHNISNNYIPAIRDFEFSAFDIGVFPALVWCRDLLQRVYESLGVYSIVITLALTLGLALQFLGYVRYKP